MAKKPVKKPKLAPQKAKKPAKPAKPTLSVSSVLKKAAKVAKKVGSGLSKPAPAGKAAKALAPQKGKVAAVPALPKGKKAAVSELVAEKGKKGAAPAAAAKGKGKKEVVLEVPAPKGVALLGKEGKKKGKGAAAEARAAASKNRCREPGCDHDHSLAGYCRLHYIKNWRKIKRKEAIIASGQLNNYVEELVNKYPDKYLEVIRQDLASEKDWAKVVVDLELESSEEESGGDDESDAMPETVRGGSSRGEFEDEGESF